MAAQMLGGIFNLHCHDVHEPIKPAAVGVGIFLIVGTALAGVPQLLLICRSRSSAGLSVITPVMVVAFGFINVCSTVTIKWRVLETCASGPGCILHLLDALQQAASTCTIASILFSTIAFPPNNGCFARGLCFALVCCLIGIGATTFVLSARASCSRAALDWAEAVSVIAAVIVTVAFAPQLVETWRSKGQGSLSVWYYAIQSVGCFLVVGTQAFGFHDNWPVWGPTGVSGCLQTAILASALYFRLRVNRQRRSSTASSLVVQPVNGADTLRSSLIDEH